MLQSCDDEQRASSTGCEVQCTSKVECSAAEMTSCTLISSAATRERVSAVRAARALHDPGTTELEHDLLDVVAGQTLLRGDLAPGHRPIVDATGQVQAHR